MSVVQDIRLNTVSPWPYDAYHSYMTSAIPTNTERYVLIDPEETEDMEVEETGKYSIFDVANWFLSKSDMTHKKASETLLLCPGLGICIEGVSPGGYGLPGMGTWAGFTCAVGAVQGIWIRYHLHEKWE